MTSRIVACATLSLTLLAAGCSRPSKSVSSRPAPSVVADVIDGLGSVSCTQAIGPDDGATCTVTAQGGYALTRLTDNGASVIGALSGDHYDIDRVTGDHVVSAFFSKVTVTASNLRLAAGNQRG